MELLKDFLVAVGGGSVALIAVLSFFKCLFFKVFEKTIDATFDKSIEKYRNKLNRSTTAYEILLKKEFDFYNKLEHQIANLVPLVQDLVYYVKGDYTEKSMRCEKYRECLIAYLVMIPEIKNETLRYQSYVPEKIFDELSALINEMQKELIFWKKTAETICETNGGTIDAVKAENICDTILNRIASSESAIKNRLTELSNL